jgi:hypothetical protein
VGNDVGDRDNGSNNTSGNAGKGDGRNANREGGGLLAKKAAAAVAAAAASYCRGCLLFIVKIFLCGIFMCGGNWQGHTSPHTLVTLEVCRGTLGGDCNCSQTLGYIITKNYLAKKHGNQNWYVVFYTKVLRTKNQP